MNSSSTPWRSAAAQVLVGDLEVPELDGDASHHLGRVLRLREGAEICATDGRGGWRSCRFDGSGAIESTGAILCDPAPSPLLTVAFALTKGDKPELVVQKLTELGVDRIVPFTSQRSVVRWDDQRAARHLSRMRRVAVEACAQCRRLWLPSIGSAGTDRVPSLGELAEILGSGGVGDGAVADAGGRPLARTDLTVLIGPEGGWDLGEVSVLSSIGGGSDRVTLGDHVLRAETAAITAGALMAALRRDTPSTPDE